VSWRLPVPEWAKILEIWVIFCYYFIEYITCPFSLYLLPFFNAQDCQVWSFDGVSEFLYIPFTDLKLFDYDFFCFFL
jgi:hypothetical protein